MALLSKSTESPDVPLHSFKKFALFVQELVCVTQSRLFFLVNFFGLFFHNFFVLALFRKLF